MKSLRLAATVAAFTIAPMMLWAAPETFKVDPVHSFIIFRVDHFNVGHVYGMFNDFKGSFVYDKDDAANDKFEIRIDANSLDTKIAKRDEDVKGPDFLNVKQFPEITFKSDSIKKVSDKNFEIAGKMTMHGVTKPVSAKLQMIGEAKDPKGAYRAGGEAKFKLKRSDFGVKGMLGMIGDEVNITVAVEGIRQEKK